MGSKTGASKGWFRREEEESSTKQLSGREGPGRTLQPCICLRSWQRGGGGDREERGLKSSQERCQTNAASIRVRLDIFSTPVFRIILDIESPGHGDQLDSRARKNSKLRLWHNDEILS